MNIAKYPEKIKYLLFKRDRHQALAADLREEIRLRAKEILAENIFRDGKDSGYTPPSGKMRAPWDNKLHFLYPFQWLWDTFFIVGWTADIEQGIKDTRIFLKSQRNDGFLGHIRYNREVLARGDYFPPANIYYSKGKLPKGEIISRITQPPNVAYGVWELAKKMDDKKRRKFLNEVFPKIVKYHEYIYTNLSVDGLMIIIHPWQNGDDNSPKWDSVYERIREADLHSKMESWLKSLRITYERLDLKLVHHSQRPIDHHYDIYLYLIWLYGSWNWSEKTILARSPFRIADPMTNGLLLRSNLALLEMARYLNKTSEAKKIDGWLKLTSGAMNRLWDQAEGLYFARDLVTSRLIKTATSSSYIPLFSKAIPQHRASRIAARIITMVKDHPLAYLIPSTEFSEVQRFSPFRYWRGPTWIVINAMIADGLINYGFSEAAKRVIDDTLRLCTYKAPGEEKFGFFEYYNPWTGEGLGSPLQSWTAAAMLFLLDRNSGVKDN